ncbi:LysM peptidoglycan-binding domain-containing protein [Sphingomonas dokdonensis]|uniref:LysM domain protein n=1 Tax=Sphingomonas dokdonensis TaxID=344880 RepID=A0A245ZFC6_9SPHN|nr:LysM domain-containing protein [Sphingomonas dokdonensis]OWK28452.1 LysM domain protein [Sphingomonas dokdonensis]
MILRRSRAAGLSLMLLALSACGGGARPNATPPRAASGNGDAGAALDRLLQGDEGAARKQLKAILKRDPNNASAQMVLASMKGDAREQLGPHNYPYTVRAGDTIDGIAQRLLGNRLKAYQLLRYNDLSLPAQLAVGQVLRIPGEQRREPPRAPAPPPAPSPAPPRPAQPAPVAQPKPAPAARPAPAANPAAARQARAAGLAALNQGKVAQAVAQLRRAAALDPGNPLIARDLARAQRIAATVRTKR